MVIRNNMSLGVTLGIGKYNLHISRYRSEIKKFRKLQKNKNTYVNHPNKSKEILKSKGVQKSEILASGNDYDNIVIKPTYGVLKGFLKTEMDTYYPRN